MFRTPAACLALFTLFLYSVAAPAADGEGPSFEVASIRPSAPPVNGMLRVAAYGGPGTQVPGRWTCENLSLSNLITGAFGLSSYQLQGPDWLDGQRFDISAKIPDGATKEQFQQMRQNMLRERFGLKFHFDKKEIAGYELVVMKNGSKLQEAQPEPSRDPAAKDADPGRSAAQNKLSIGKDGLPMIPRGATGMVMTSGRARSQWAGIPVKDLAVFIANQIRKPVIDRTGLDAKYDITLEWAPDPAFGMAPPANLNAPLPVAPEPSGPSIFDALREQLGLRLQPNKVSVDILVIDQIEKTPTEN